MHLAIKLPPLFRSTFVEYLTKNITGNTISYCPGTDYLVYYDGRWRLSNYIKGALVAHIARRRVFFPEAVHIDGVEYPAHAGIKYDVFKNMERITQEEKVMLTLDVLREKFGDHRMELVGKQGGKLVYSYQDRKISISAYYNAPRDLDMEEFEELSVLMDLGASFAAHSGTTVFQLGKDK